MSTGTIADWSCDQRLKRIRGMATMWNVVEGHIESATTREGAETLADVASFMAQLIVGQSEYDHERFGDPLSPDVTDEVKASARRGYMRHERLVRL